MKKQAKEEKIRVNKKGKKKKHIFLRVVLILLLIIIVAGAILAYKLIKRYNEDGWSGVSMELLGHDEDTVNKLDKIYCLILGQSQNLTDTIMLASYDPKTQEAALLSIPRDTFVGNNPAYATAWDKINAVYQTGVENLLEDVRSITGINVQYYVKVDTEALKVLVDEIGGVYFEVPIDMHYTDRGQNLYINLKAGYQLLDGDKAEQVVRFRHNNNGSTYPQEYGGEDLGRMRTQRAFLTALLEKVINNMDVNTIFSFMDIAKQYVETNIDFNAVKDYVPYILEFNIDNLQTATLPGEAVQANNGTWIYTVDEEAAEETINELFYGITPTDEIDGNVISGNTISDNSLADTTSSLKVEVLNGSGSSSKLSKVVSELKAAGFNVIQTGNTSTTNNTTVIERNNMTEEEKASVKEILGTESIASGDSSSMVDITIIIGTDFEN